MTGKKFEKMCMVFTAKALHTMAGPKAAQYAGREDRLAAFHKGAAVRLGTKTAEDICLDYMTKHWVHLLDLVSQAGAEDPRPLEEWDDVLTDIINYCLLMRGLVIDREQ